MPRTYVDNASNRSLGRVGMPVGSMVVSRSSSGGGGAGYSSGSGYSGNGGGGNLSSGYAGSSNRATGTWSSSERTTVRETSSASSSETYVDNAYNRSLERVGMEHGTAVVSRSSGNSSGYSRSDREPKTYVDNASNRRLGRVGMEHGTAVVSRSNGNSSGYSRSDREPKTYVDNTHNRQLGRVGMEHGTAVVNKAATCMTPTQQRPTSPKQYVDNAYNRKLGRVGHEYGTSTPPGNLTVDICTAGKVYKDNRLNRNLQRVGLPVGTAVYDKRTGLIRKEVYADNPVNQRLGRVGQPRGSQPSNKKSPATDRVIQLQRKMRDQDAEIPEADDDYRGIPEEPGWDSYDDQALEKVVCGLNRREEEMEWMQTEGQTEPPRTIDSVITNYSGTIIPYSELQLHKKIGQGGFGDVYFAKWRGSVVAVKKLRVDKLSKKRVRDFSEEVMTFCKLNDPNVVQFIGACVDQPNLCIVMEYMQMSLFDGLHIDEDIEFSEQEQLDIIRQMCSGLQYLHDMEVAHCDLKSQNVLLDYMRDKTCTAKITDFGLSMVKSNTETSSAAGAEMVRNVGTPRYSAPEILRGELLSAKDMMKADVYSIGLIIFEVIHEEEPFYNLTYAQLQRQVGQDGITPAFDDGLCVDVHIQSCLTATWSFKPLHRPSIGHIQEVFSEIDAIYIK